MEAGKNKLDAYFKDLGKLISKFRKEKGFTLEELGSLIGHDRSSMHRIEAGTPLTLKTILKLSIALDKKPKEFLDITFDFQSHELSGLITDKKSPKRKPKVKRAKKA